MRRGRKICDELKAIRQRIADDNGIEYAPAECTHEGECAGTCPRCESEVRYLEGELRRRSALGKAVIVGGLSLSMSALGSCVNACGTQPAGYVENPDSTITAAQGDSTCELLEGDVMAEPDTVITTMPQPTEGMIMREPDSVPPQPAPKK